MMEQIVSVYSAAFLPIHTPSLPSTQRTLRRRCLFTDPLFLVPDAVQNRKFRGEATFDKELENADEAARGAGIVSRYKRKGRTASV
jgi:hypothetical protein